LTGSNFENADAAVPIPAEALAELKEIYAAADRRIADLGIACRMDGECCRFGRSGLTLFATLLEARHLFRDPCPADAAERAGEVCPFLEEGCCTRRARRTLGCRIHFCRDGAAEKLAAIYESVHRAIKDLHVRHGLPYRYRKLSDWARLLS
jgi:hypothetical protein